MRFILHIDFGIMCRFVNKLAALRELIGFVTVEQKCNKVNKLKARSPDILFCFVAFLKDEASSWTETTLRATPRYLLPHDAGIPEISLHDRN